MKIRYQQVAASAAAIALLVGAMSTTVAAKEAQEGMCSVRQNAPEPPCPRGMTATAIVQGRSHDACTAAKARARENLLARIPAECGAYIDCSKPCKRINQ